MSFFNRLTAVMLAAALTGPVMPLQARSRKGDKDFAQGRLFEQKKDWDNALDSYRKALAEDPSDIQYQMAAQKARFQASQAHVENGEKIRGQGLLGDAMLEFQRAFAIDPGSTIAVQEIRTTQDMVERERLVAYLQKMGGLEGRGPEDALAMAQAISSFSIHQVGWFVLLLTLSVGLLTLVLSGYFSGRRAKAGAILLGLLLSADLVLANVPWVVTWNWVQKYATNPVIEMLKDKPYEHRVAVLPFTAPSQFAMFSQVYDIEWKQQLFPYNNIQTLDVIMMPRAPVDYEIGR